MIKASEICQDGTNIDEILKLVAERWQNNIRKTKLLIEIKGQLEGKVALVTGGGSGIGRATALGFTKEAARIVVADIDTQASEETVWMIKEAGGEAMFSKVNVAIKAEVKVLINKVVETYDRLDCAFNNAELIMDGGYLAQ